ncbi:response regulator transcription factor [Micromonospora eburnea]|uniref:DNA-binding response regulator, NarL/FixJ family, contains REC and HTH domains n=1 Tax=Micromonospora eburnea TaxID=227316 RepID=A0A1C6UUV6_9ACTN|nr:LuxR C-terminal-related transcriptional regulator [Micromonospora eburnea]SCL57864.1 DNA-binding response regulator, NarL/FixJ family, contains REC and HTH domains [Micromonospora eburnea]
MGEPVSVNVVALDPVLEAGTTSALFSCPDITVVVPGEPAWVTVVIVDDVSDEILDLVRATRAKPHRPEVVLVAAELAAAAALHAIAAGARGLLRRRDASPDRLVHAVLAAASGDCIVPPDMLDGLLEHGAVARDPALAAVLTERERAVLRMVAEGHETGDIARALCYSPRTVTSVLHDITHRYRLRNRAHAVAYALRAGLL